MNHPNEHKMKFLKVSDPDGKFIIGDTSALKDMVGTDLDFRSVGEKFIVEVIELTQAEYDELPEFEG